MSAIDLLNAALPAYRELPEEPTVGVCCVTGVTESTIHRRHAIYKSFTNLDLLKAPHSDRIGIPAWHVMTYSEANPGKKRASFPLRQSHWVCKGEDVEYLDRRGVRRHVLNGVDAERWCGYATTSYKKHGSLRAPENTDGQQVWLWELTMVDCSDRDRVTDTWTRLRAAQDNGIHRPLIESLDISPGYMAKIGWRRWRDFEAWARPRVRSPLYQFLAYLLPSKEELQCESAS